MCSAMKELPVRKHLRLKGYDYSHNGAYYITICVKDRHELLGKIAVGATAPGRPLVELPEPPPVARWLNCPDRLRSPVD